MSRVIAALDDSPVTEAVLLTAKAFAALVDARVDPIHVVEAKGPGGGVPARVAEGATRAIGLSVRAIEGPLVEALVGAGGAEDVAALVVGARRSSTDPRPLGSTAFAVATSLGRPIVVVPPDAPIRNEIRRVFVPVEGTPSSSGLPELILEIVRHTALDVVAAYVASETDPPAFTDQPQHEGRAWAAEFVRRYCTVDLNGLRLHTHIGRPEELIPVVSEQVDPDLIALSWSQQLGRDRAWVVRAVLERCRRPVLLVPVNHDPSS
jgi:hypothetical protein